jgi:hypothetical protein
VAVKAEIGGREFDAKVLSGGAVQLSPVVTVIRGSDGAIKELIFEHVTDRKKEEVRRHAAENGFELIESESCTEQKAEVSMSGTLRLIGEAEGLRLASKIAYTGFALRLGGEFAIRNTSEPVRAYIRTGEGAPSARLFLNRDYLANCAQGPHQHSIVIVGRKEKHLVSAIVRLFGVLSYLVTLSQEYNGADFYNTLVYDAQRGDINGVLVGNLQSEFLQIEHVETNKETVWNDRAASGNSLVEFIHGEINSKSRRRVEATSSRT